MFGDFAGDRVNLQQQVLVPHVCVDKAIHILELIKVVNSDLDLACHFKCLSIDEVDVLSSIGDIELIVAVVADLALVCSDAPSFLYLAVEGVLAQYLQAIPV